MWGCTSRQLLHCARSTVLDGTNEAAIQTAPRAFNARFICWYLTLARPQAQAGGHLHCVQLILHSRDGVSGVPTSRGTAGQGTFPAEIRLHLPCTVRQSRSNDRQIPRWQEGPFRVPARSPAAPTAARSDHHALIGSHSGNAQPLGTATQPVTEEGTGAVRGACPATRGLRGRAGRCKTWRSHTSLYGPYQSQRHPAVPTSTTGCGASGSGLPAAG